MRQLVLDAGPLVAFFYSKDPEHSSSRRGFEQLISSKTILLTPVSVVFEVYKWLLHRGSPQVAQKALNGMQETLKLVYLEAGDLEGIFVTVRSLPDWRGSLEDASVIWVANRYQCPVWTYNYRDFGVFKSLDFWNPE